MPRKRRGHRSGFVSILGRPNAGKSTLLNALIGQKLAIVTSKPQTTRTVVQGVLTLPQAQVVFVDTPGIHRGESLLNRRMMDEVRAALEERDLLCYVMDSTRNFGEADADAIRLVKDSGTPAVAVLSKVDVVREKPRLLQLIEQVKAVHEFEEYVPVSALRGEGLDRLQELIVGRLPAGPALFPEDYLTDQPERFLAAELVREKVLRATREEVPHSIAVLVEEWVEEGRLVRIGATIYVERDGQKGIIIGSKGETLKRIGTEARLEIERLLDRRVYLELFVKVRENWRESPQFLNDLDWRSMVGMDAPAAGPMEEEPT